MHRYLTDAATTETTSLQGFFGSAAAAAEIFRPITEFYRVLHIVPNSTKFT